jgi:hypothetical protein
LTDKEISGNPVTDLFVSNVRDVPAIDGGRLVKSVGRLFGNSIVPTGARNESDEFGLLREGRGKKVEEFSMV